MRAATLPFATVTAFALALTAHGAKPAPVTPEKTPPAKPLLVKSLEQAKTLPAGTESVQVTYAYGLHKDGRFVAIMKALAANPKIRHLRLELPNSSHIKNEHLEVLREFKSLENFDLEDDRDFGGDEILKLTASMPLLKKVKFEFG